MNRRLQELWDQAAASTKDDSWESQVAFMEEFAKLVIMDTHEVIVIDGVDDIDVVYEYFGIKE